MNKLLRYLLIGGAVALAVTILDGFYVLPEGMQAVVTQFGKPVGQAATEAGLKFKTPFIQDVTFFDKKIQIWDGEPNQIPTKDKTFIYIDATARWRISDPLLFLKTVNNITKAQGMLDDIVDSTVRDLVNKNNLVELIRSSDWARDETLAVSAVRQEEVEEVITLGRDKITNLVHESAAKVMPKYGIDLVDVMIKRVNYIASVEAKVFERMISERKRIAAEKRSLGEGLKSEILGKVERELKEITSTASREAQEIKGKADAEATRIYARAYNQDPEFYAFYKSLETYKSTIGDNTRLVISSDSQFYKYLGSIK